MGSYENFARVYDELMDNVPYEEWAQFILNLLQDRKITEGLGIGTWMWNRKADDFAWQSGI